MALVGATAADVRDIMVEGPSGILNIGPPHERPTYEPSRRKLTWPDGAEAHTYSAEEPERLRGPEHDAAYCDELSSWRHQRSGAREEISRTQAERAWHNLMLGLRIGDKPQTCVTTTPKPVPLLKQLLTRRDGVVVTTGSTYENRANLAGDFFTEIGAYEGTRLGLQELHGRLLEDVEGALWSAEMIETTRVDEAPPLRRVVVAVDPSGGDAEGHDEVGIIVAGIGFDGHGYVLADYSGRMSPDGWGRKVLAAYDDYEADAIVAEVNYGGAMAEHVIRSTARSEGRGTVRVKQVHASRGKRIRAEPVAAVYEQGRIHHVGVLPGLEEQMTTWDAAAGMASPDRLDAAVWALSELEFARVMTSSPMVGVRGL